MNVTVASDSTQRIAMLTLTGAPNVEGLDRQTGKRAVVAPHAVSITWVNGTLQGIAVLGRNVRSGGAYSATLIYASDGYLGTGELTGGASPLSDAPAWVTDLVGALTGGVPEDLGEIRR